LRLYIVCGKVRSQESAGFNGETLYCQLLKVEERRGDDGMKKAGKMNGDRITDHRLSLTQLSCACVSRIICAVKYALLDCNIGVLQSCASIMPNRFFQVTPPFWRFA
jgi:hypothetical protein